MLRIYLSRVKNLFLNLIVAFISISCLFPVIWMLYSSLKTESEFAISRISLPKELNFDNFSKAFEIGRMQDYFMNSLFNAVVSVIFIVIFSFFIAYFFARYDFKFKRMVYFIVLFGLVIPIHGLLVPIFIQFSSLGMLDNRFTLILPYVAFGLPTAVFLLDSFIKTIPIEIEEAAVIDGCSLIQRMILVILPLCRPIISTIIVLSFLSSWNEFPFALTLLTSNDFKTVPIGLTNFSGQYSTDYTQLMAGLVITVLPVIIVYLGLNKQIVKGMTAGAVKG